MALSKTIKRELEVAFSKHAQPVWFRVLKYLLLAGLFYFCWGRTILGVILLVLIVLSLFIHFWYRYKTNGWTRSYGLWDYDKNKPEL